MNAVKIVGIMLIIAGALGLIYGGFSYTTESTKAKLGSLELKMQEEHSVNVPVFASAAALAIGVFLIVAGGKK